MYIQGMAAQTRIFLLCIGFGFVFGLISEAVRFIRKMISLSKRAVFIQDIVCFILLTVFIFFFLLCVSSGEIRLYIISGIALGYIIYTFSVGRFLCFLSDKASLFIRNKIKVLKSNKKTSEKSNNI
ncbi:MAG: spore cortex biosynthesis protein YabQ [Clostridia bacterium]|nr:spore cortex biosynthesis protein YabQ [Clostridia bacterium]